MNKRKTGSGYEDMAAEFLKNEGYEIRCRNYRNRTGEIDIIAKEGRYLVFIEVKFRSSGDKGGPLAAVGYKKQKTISRVAAYYLLEHGLPDTTPCRFDVVGITPEKTILIRDAFLFCP